ncbi:MAG: Oligoendopeptidase F [Candidatus Bipolaricaulis sibiricus]|uniref:Oligoendopeptidase F n=1 Tax=Bipolaricaulis sibiricus TaxID=2501609 RepID=A0A410FS30_BIPS1|nr:MAG: Oligoendopeptidase F [Candidatus Bipolaricaulis sibiricus]
MTEKKLPHWDLSPLFASLDDPAFTAAWTDLQARLQALEPLFNKHEVGPRPMRDSDRAAFDEITTAINGLLDAFLPVRAFVSGQVDTDSTNQAAQARLSELQRMFLLYERLRPRLTAWLARLDPERINAGPYKLMLDEARVQAEHMMSEPEEILAAELRLSGGSAWTKLHGNVSSLITATVGGKELPITAVRNLAHSPDPKVRKEAYDAELAAWKAHEVPLAAALNGVKGEASTLNRKRRWRDDLEPVLVRNRISPQVLAAMQEAVVASFPVWHRYFRAKARLLGKPQLDWWDLAAPVGTSEKTWTWDEGAAFIVEQLRTFSPSDAAVAETAFRDRWIDAEPRKGKRGGAYCMPIGGGKSRILANFEESFDSVSTIAHELGHAYHNHCLRERPPLLRMYPMTLAETASIMNETIVVQAALKTLPAKEQLPILEADLQGAAQVVVDIHSRFLFEKAVFEKRAGRELSADEFCALMLDAQRATYGDALATYHPYMWAVKPHYYGTDFYNFPYTFGLLFGLALYQKYVQEGEAFVARYDDLLASVGIYPAQELAGRFGFDLESRSFWEGGLAVLGERVAQFEQLAK